MECTFLDAKTSSSIEAHRLSKSKQVIKLLNFSRNTSASFRVINKVMDAAFFSSSFYSYEC